MLLCFFVTKTVAKGSIEEYVWEPQDLSTGYPEILFIIFCLLSASLIQWSIARLPKTSPPVSILYFVFGLLVYLFHYFVDSASIFGMGVSSIAHINSTVVYFAFMPILLYEATQNINWHMFKRFFVSGIALAIFGVVFQVAILGFLIAMSLPGMSFPGASPKTKWLNSFLVASALGSTDPVAVVSVLGALDAPEKLASMFDGESLINDGSAIFLFQVFRSIVSATGSETTYKQILPLIFTLLFLGPILGLCLGVVVYLWVNRFRDHHYMQVLALLSTGYLGFFIAEVWLRASGPLTVVTFGIFIRAFAHIALDRGAQVKHQAVTQSLGLYSNALIFIFSGVIGMRMLLPSKTQNTVENLSRNIPPVYWTLPPLFVYLNFARALMIVCFSPILRKTGYGVNVKEMTLLAWGGLRGSIVLILGLMLEQNSQLIDILPQNQALYLLSGSTFSILLANGITFEPLYRYLNLYPPAPFRKVYLERVMKMIDYEYFLSKERLNSYWLFDKTNVLKYGDSVVPLFGWRKLRKDGTFATSVPSVKKAFQNLPDLDIHINSPRTPVTSRSSLSDYSSSSDSNSGLDIAGGRNPLSDPDTDTSFLRKKGRSTAAQGQRLREPKEGMKFDPLLNLRLVEHVMEEINKDDYEEEFKANINPERDDLEIQRMSPEEWMFPRYSREGYEVDDAMSEITDATLCFPLSEENNLTVLKPKKKRGTKKRKGKKKLAAKLERSRSLTSSDSGIHKLGDTIPFTLSSLDSRECNLTSRPRSHLYLPQRFVADNEERDEEEETMQNLSAQTLPLMNHAKDHSSGGESDTWLEMPATPGRDLDQQDARPRSMIKVIRREREGELFIMVFNAVRQMYKKLYAENFISGSSYLSLRTCLDLANDFVLSTLRSTNIPVWIDALKDMREEATDAQQLFPSTPSDGFSVEWQIVRSRLECSRTSMYRSLVKKFTGKFGKSFVEYPAAKSDFQSVVSFVDTHEELLSRGGSSLKHLLGSRLMFKYLQQLKASKEEVLNIKQKYPQTFRYALTVHAATMLLNLKSDLVQAQVDKGLVLEQDGERLKDLLYKQLYEVSRFHP